jgi:raffinose/stachyose/melibiose transport system permease protein
MATIQAPARPKRPPQQPSQPSAARAARNLGRRVLLAGTYLLLTLMALGVIYPLIWMALNGFKTNAELFGSAWGLPGQFRWSNFATAWTQGVVRYLFNSVLVTVVSIVGVVIISAWAAYGLTRLRLPLAGPVTMIILGGLMLAPTVALVPLFQLLRSLRLYDTYAGLIILYIAFRIPFTLFLIRAYMFGLPHEVEEAARVDGASNWQIFWRVVFPMSRPVLVSAALLQAIFAWNEFPFALVFINNPNLKTLPVGLLDMQSRLLTNWPVMFAALTLAALPMIIAFLVGQRQFIRGLAEGFGK